MPWWSIGATGGRIISTVDVSGITFWWTCESTTLGADDYSAGDTTATLNEAAEIHADANKSGANGLKLPTASDRAAGPMAGALGAAAVEEKTEFDVILTAHGEKKINVIKEVRAITGLGLKEAKRDLVENPPKPVKEGVPKADAEKIKAQLEGAGATVEIK